MRKHEAPLLISLIGILCAASLAAAQGPQGGAMPPPEVTVAPALIKTIPLAYEYVGMTEASKVVEIRARIQGFLETRDFQEGAYIEAGQTLYTIDDRSFKADWQIAAAQVAQAESRLKLAEQELKRLQSVDKPGAVAQADLDTRAAELSSAEASLQLAKAQLAKAELELSYTRITAPLNGFIGKTMKEIGSLVDSSQNSLLAEMQQVDPVYANFKVSETDYLAWRHDMDTGVVVLSEGVTEPYLTLTLIDGTEYGERGKLNFEEVDVSLNTGSIEMRGVFKNPDKRLKPGQYVTVHLAGWERPNTLTVPRRAVAQSPEGPYVYIVNADQKVERRLIQAGSWAGDDWAVLSGLEAGTQVIVEGLTKIRPGMEVKVVDGSMQAPPSPADAAEANTSR